MSLLMDALKRAEANKQEGNRPPPEPLSLPGDTLSLEPLGDESAALSGVLPTLAPHQGAVDADLARTLVPETQAATQAADTPRDQRQRETARNAFAAKQSPTPSRWPLWLALGTLGVAGLGIGGYVWHELNNLNRGTLGPVSQSPGLPTPANPNPLPPVASSPLLQRPEPPALSTVAGDRPARASAFQPSPPRAAPADNLQAEPAIPIRLTRTPAETETGLQRAHASLQRGDLATARREYEQSLRRDPNNSDALLALAAIAQHQGRQVDADALRQRALIANPGEPSVQAATLNNMSADADPLATESRLKTLLASQPESGPLNFALGNLYSRQKRWAEAQQAYFNALAADGDNPDFLFNQAVSLDHLRQSRLAAQHYRLALEAATRRPAAFEPSAVERRLEELGQALNR